MRDEITKIFINEITPHLSEIKSIAFVGGSEKDPEAKILKEMGKNGNMMGLTGEKDLVMGLYILTQGRENY